MRSWVLVLDIDGTLLPSDQHRSPRLVRALRRVQTLGHIPVVATGRRRKTARAIARLLGLDGVPLVVCDGAAAFASMDDPAPVFIHPLPEDALTCAAALAAARDVGLLLYSPDDIYMSDFRIGRLVRRVARTLLRRRLAGFRVLIQDVLHPPRRLRLDEAAGFVGAVKGVFQSEDPEIRRTMDPLVDFTMPPGHGSEFVAKGISKASGVSAILSRLGRTWEDVLAFGDNWNDLAVLRRAKFGFVMGNHVRDLPTDDLIPIPSADEDGLAFVLERLDDVVAIPTHLPVLRGPLEAEDS